MSGDTRTEDSTNPNNIFQPLDKNSLRLFSNIPEELRNSVQWVCWKAETRKDKLTKIPFNPITGEGAKSNNSSTWVSFSEACKGYESGKYDGIGFVLSPPYIGIDIDDCRNLETGEIDQDILGIIADLNSYTEISPSGNGIHIFVKGVKPGKKSRIDNIEIYEKGRYFTVTGNVLEYTPLSINDSQTAIDAFYGKCFGKEEEHPPIITGRGGSLSDDDIINRARQAENAFKFIQLFNGNTDEYQSQSQADVALCDLIAFYTLDKGQIDRIFRQSKLYRKKWDEKHGEDTYGNITISRAIGFTNQNKSNSNDLRNEALNILVNGKPLQMILDTFNLDHTGDKRACVDISYVCVSSIVANSIGLHTFLSGESGKGKTHSVDVFMRQIPDAWKIVSTFSDKYLFYASKPGEQANRQLKEGMVVVLDDHTFNERVQEIFKTGISRWREGVEYGTVVNQTSSELRLPPRISWILMKVDDPGDDQVMKRMDHVRIEDSEEQQIKTIELIKASFTNLKAQTVLKERREVLICREMWNLLKRQRISVEIPYSKEIQFADKNYRNIIRFYMFIMAHAALHLAQRPHTGKTEDGIPIIEAIRDDFEAAKEHYIFLFTHGAQSHNLVKRESDVIECLLSLKPKDGVFTVQEVGEESQRLGNPIEEQQIRRALNGRGTSNTAEKLGGLLEKCPYIRSGGSRTNYETEEDITYKDENSRCIEVRKRTSHNQHIYSVDVDALKGWYRENTPVWINPEYKWNTTNALPLYQALPQLFKHTG